MKKKAVKITAYCLTGTIVFGSQGLAANAGSVSSELPGAGIEIVMNEIYSADTNASIIEYLNAAVNSEFDNIAISSVKNFVHIREEATEDSESLGKLYADSAATILEEGNDWVKVQSGKVNGYIKKDYLLLGEEAAEAAEKLAEKKITVDTLTLNVREEGSQSAGIVAQVGIGEEFKVKEETDNGWYKVSVEGKEGYVSSEYVDEEAVFNVAESNEEEEIRLAEEERKRQEEERRIREAEEIKQKEREAVAEKHAGSDSQSISSNKSSDNAGTTAAGNKSSESSDSSNYGSSETTRATGGSGQAVADYALQFVGNPYQHGGNSLTNGTDCSGFVHLVYKNFGQTVARQSTALRSSGRGVSYSEAQPGDIICYDGHVAIYIGGGQIVHASDKKTGIKVSNATYTNIVAVRRVFE